MHMLLIKTDNETKALQASTLSELQRKLTTQALEDYNAGTINLHPKNTIPEHSIEDSTDLTTAAATAYSVSLKRVSYILAHDTLLTEVTKARDRIKELQDEIKTLEIMREQYARQLLTQGEKKVDVAYLAGVSRQTVHSWTE